MLTAIIIPLSITYVQKNYFDRSKITAQDVQNMINSKLDQYEVVK